MRARVPEAAVLAVAAIGGAGTMTVELAAVRLLAPWFGSSLVVWTNVIAVVLLALALGYLVGGWLSTRGRPLRRLAWMLGLAAIWTAWLPALSSPVAAFFLPQDLTLDEAAPLVLWGSLACSLVLFLPPAALLGAVAPLAVEAVQELEQGTAGHAGGAVLCVSTLGSLVGVFGTSLIFVQHLGLSGTFLLAAGFLMVAGLAGLWLSRGEGARDLAPAVFWLVPLGLSLAAGRVRGPELAVGQVELAAAESAYQSVRVVEDTRSEPPMRFLQVNEGFDSYQSAWQPEPGLLPRGFYYNDFVLPAHWAAKRGEWEMLVLGMGAGTALRVLQGAAPAGLEIRCTGIELDPVVVALAREHMDLPESGAGIRIRGDLDARVGMRGLTERFDQIVLDCYANQVEIPPHLCTREFFAEVRDRLVEDGWLTANLGGFDFDDPVVATVARTCAAAFETPVLLVRVPQARNYTLFARRNGDLPLDADGRLRGLEGAAGRILAPRELPDSFRIVEPEEGRLILTDDRCPIEILQLESIARGRELLSGGGSS